MEYLYVPVQKRVPCLHTAPLVTEIGTTKRNSYHNGAKPLKVDINVWHLFEIWNNSHNLSNMLQASTFKFFVS